MNQKTVEKLRKLSPVFHERDPFVLPHRLPSQSGEVFIDIGNRRVNTQAVRGKRHCEENSLMELVSHLGVGPGSPYLSICEGFVAQVDPWDGIGYMCHIGSTSAFGTQRPNAQIYDFDLWNFRWTDNDGPWMKRPGAHLFNCHAEYYAWQRFGDNVDKITKLLRGCLKFKKFRMINTAVEYVIDNIELQPA